MTYIYIYALLWGMYGRFVAEVSNLPLRAKMRIQKSLFVAYATKSDIFYFLILALLGRFEPLDL